MKVLLIGNYVADQQQSMIRYANLVLAALVSHGVEAQLMTPPIVVNRRHFEPVGLGRFVNYIDKMGIAPGLIHRQARWADVVHVCDHSNSFYVPSNPDRPWVVTCHDMLAVRGARGEDTDCPATAMGRRLQGIIVGGLERAQLIASVSQYTDRDVERIVGPAVPRCIIPNALNYPFRPLERSTALRLLQRPCPWVSEPFIFHVGSNQARKNKETLIEAMALVKDSWPGRLVLAGPALSPALKSRIQALGLGDRIVPFERPGNAELHALYALADALVFPSRFEGFGWPIAEAQACGCPVVTSDAEPMREVAGGAAELADPNDRRALADAILRVVTDESRRHDLIERGIANAERFTPAAMAHELVAAYQRTLAS